MVTVAIAAGTGQVGRSIASVLKENPNHQVIILSRNASEIEDDAKAPVHVVDYSDIDAVAKLLHENSVHTVISAIQTMLPGAGQAEIHLVKAAAKSAATRRFIASVWGFPLPKGQRNLVQEATLEALRNTDLEFTQFTVGMFSDYCGMPHIKSYLAPHVGFIDFENCMAALPGDGNAVQAFTYTLDMARFVEAALDLPQGEWPETAYCWSEKLTQNEIVRLAEEARGTKFTVVYDSVDKLMAGEVSELPGYEATYKTYPKAFLLNVLSVFGLSIVQGRNDLPEENSLNRRFPDLKTTTMKEIVDAWKGK